MTTTTIRLSQIDDVKNFVNTIMRFDYDIDLASGRYAVDAKSNMVTFYVHLSKPFDLNAHTEGAEELFEAIDKYIVK